MRERNEPRQVEEKSGDLRVLVQALLLNGDITLVQSRYLSAPTLSLSR